MRTLATAVALGTLVLPLTGLPTAPTYAADTCHGQAVTLTGTPGQLLTGTEGPDVVDANGASIVLALGGDDVICSSVDTFVDAGAGDDVVDTTTSTGTSTTRLGSGDDVFVGGPHDDRVRAGGVPAAPGEAPDVDVDTIDTGAGGARVISGSPGRANSDRISMGAAVPGASNSVTYFGTQSPDGSLSFGAGGNSLNLIVARNIALDLVIDNEQRRVTSAGVVALTWSGEVIKFRPTLLRPGGSLKFLGDGSDERLNLDQVVGAELDVDMGPGNDRISGDEGACRKPRTSAITGGPGHDWLKWFVGCLPAVTLDLSRHVLDYPDTVADPDGAVRGIEQVQLSAKSVVLRGDRWSNLLRVSGCRVRVRGGSGADRVVVMHQWGGCGLKPPYSEVSGGAGPDRLLGSRNDDVLYGGPGRDFADGGKGTDTCRSEVRRNCEHS